MLIVDMESTYEIESELMPGHVGTFKPVTPRERGRYTSMIFGGMIGEMPVQVFEDHIVNFRPLENAQGNKVPFKKADHLNIIPYEVQAEMGNILLKKNTLNEEEIKN